MRQLRILKKFLFLYFPFYTVLWKVFVFVDKCFLTSIFLFCPREIVSTIFSSSHVVGNIKINIRLSYRQIRRANFLVNVKPWSPVLRSISGFNDLRRTSTRKDLYCTLSLCLGTRVQNGTYFWRWRIVAEPARTVVRRSLTRPLLSFTQSDKVGFCVKNVKVYCKWIQKTSERRKPRFVDHHDCQISASNQ